MRKRTVNHLAETIFWNIVYFIPIFAFLILLFTGGSAIQLGSVFESIGLNISTDSVAYTSLSAILGQGGTLPLFASGDLLVFMTYYINVFICHLFVDFILFVPKLAKKWLNKFTQGEE